MIDRGTLEHRIRWYVRASGPKGGAFRWRYPTRKAAQTAARKWRKKHGTVAVVWAASRLWFQDGSGPSWCATRDHGGSVVDIRARLAKGGDGT